MVLHARIGAEDFYAKQGYRTEGSIFDENTIPHIKMTKLLSERTSPHDLGGQL
jgi:predicted GNAT family N-acyltransferase